MLHKIILANALFLSGIAPVAGNRKDAPPAPAPGLRQELPTPAFDVASIHPTAPDDDRFAISPNPNNFRVTGATLKYLVQYAYDLEDYQIKGGPAWVSNAHFDIVAKADPSEVPASTSADRGERDKVLQQRLRSLLADRFNLHVVKESKPTSGYALTVAKGGTKLQPGKPEGGYTFSQGLLVCNNFSMSDLAAMLASIVRKPVSNKINDKTTYSFSLKWSPDNLNTDQGAPPAIFTALQEQLGLKLKTATEDCTLLTIEDASQPSAN